MKLNKNFPVLNSEVVYIHYVFYLEHFSKKKKKPILPTSAHQKAPNMVSNSVAMSTQSAQITVSE